MYKSYHYATHYEEKMELIATFSRISSVALNGGLGQNTICHADISNVPAARREISSVYQYPGKWNIPVGREVVPSFIQCGVT